MVFGDNREALLVYKLLYFFENLIFIGISRKRLYHNPELLVNQVNFKIRIKNKKMPQNIQDTF